MLVVKSWMDADVYLEEREEAFSAYAEACAAEVRAEFEREARDDELAAEYEFLTAGRYA